MPINSLLLIIPCFNEKGRVDLFLPNLCAALEEHSNIFIRIVDDASSLAQQEHLILLVTRLRNKYKNLLPIQHLPKNLGKGGAIYAGWKNHNEATWLGFVDADGSCSPQEIIRIINHANLNSSGLSAFFASRVKMLGRSVHRNFKRHIIGRIYATFVSEMLHIPAYDTQCGLKLIPRKAFEVFSNKLIITGFAFDVELLIALLKNSFTVEEFPIDWDEVPGGKVNLLSDSIRMFKDIIRIRKNWGSFN